MTICSRIFVKGDPHPFWVSSPPDVVVTELEQAIDAGEDFVRFEDVSIDGTPAMPLYVQPHSVTAVTRLAQSVIDDARAAEELA